MFRTPERDVHIHVYAEGSQEIVDYLDLRDWLRGDAEGRERYAAVKRALSTRPWADMNDYADAKSDIVQDTLRRAREWRCARHRAVVQRLFDEVWNGRRFEALDELYGPDLVVDYRPYSPLGHGPQHIRDAVERAWAAFPDYHEECLGVITEGWRGRGARADDRDTGRAVGPVAPHRQAARVRGDHPPRLRRSRPRRASARHRRQPQRAPPGRRHPDACGPPNDALGTLRNVRQDPTRWFLTRVVVISAVAIFVWAACFVAGGVFCVWAVQSLLNDQGAGIPTWLVVEVRLLRRVGNRRLHALAPRRNGAAQSRSPRTARRYATTCRPRTRGNRCCGRHADARALRHRG